MGGEKKQQGVREHIPLEQGLRRLLNPFIGNSVPCQRAYSIRTRIKTSLCNCIYVGSMCQRAYSIRTRIKTYLQCTKKSPPTYVREHIPLEQGLRLVGKTIFACPKLCQRAYSIRTRIKTPDLFNSKLSIVESESIFH